MRSSYLVCRCSGVTASGSWRQSARSWRPSVSPAEARMFTAQFLAEDVFTPWHVRYRPVQVAHVERFPRLKSRYIVVMRRSNMRLALLTETSRFQCANRERVVGIGSSKAAVTATPTME